MKSSLSVSDDGFVMKDNRLLIPKKLRGSVLKDVHAGHRGREACKSRARLVVYWPRIDNDIDVVCQSCEKCVLDRPSNPQERELHLPKPSRAFEIISADFADYDGLSFLIITDWKTGWFSTRPVKRKDAKTTVHELRDFISDTAVPTYLFTDNGQPFPSSEVQDFLKRWGIKWISSSPLYPQSNSYAENGVKSAKSLLRKCIKGKKIDYEEWSRGLLAIRNTPNKDGVSPAMMLYGHMVKDVLPAHKKTLQKSWHKELSLIDKKVAEEKQRYENRRSLVELKVGDAVVVQNRNNKRWDKYGVVQEATPGIRRYKIRMSSGLVTVRNRRDLKKRFPPETVPQSGTSRWSPFTSDETSHYQAPRYQDYENELKSEVHSNEDDDDDDDDQSYQATIRTPVQQRPAQEMPVPQRAVQQGQVHDIPQQDPQREKAPRKHVRFDIGNPRRSTRANKGKRPAYQKDYVLP